MVKKNSYFYFDLDGTLLNNKRVMSEKTKIFLQKFSKNHKIGFITGRPYFMIKNIVDAIKPSLPSIASNGAQAIHYDKKLWFEKIEDSISKDLFWYLKKMNATFAMYSSDTMYYYKGWDTNWFPWVKNILKSRPDQYKWNFQETKEPIPKIGKFLCLFDKGNHKNEFEKFKKHLSSFQEIHGTSSLSGVIDVMALGIDKGRAMQKLEKLGIISLKDTIAFGDNDNDISMLEVAGFSIAMKNSADHIKNMTSDITNETNDDDGVIKYLENNVK